jgi:CO/xanthine dehydrogenase FAD-binding subunit
LEEALYMLKNGQCTVFAGGTDLMVKRKQWSGTLPKFTGTVVFIDNIEELMGIQRIDDKLHVGAACTIAQMLESPLVPGFMKPALQQMASPAIRNMATLGGNICNSSPAGDSLPPLYAAEACLALQSAEGGRTLPISDFITGPGKNVLREDELLREVIIPLEDMNISEYRKVGTRKSTAISKLSFIGLAHTEGGRLLDIRLAFGAVGPAVIKDRDIEKEIVGMSLQGCLNTRVIRDMYADKIKPIDDQRSTASYRKAASLKLLGDFLENRLFATDCWKHYLSS